MNRVTSTRINLYRSRYLVVKSRQYRSSKKIKARRKNKEFTLSIGLLRLPTKEIALSFRRSKITRRHTQVKISPSRYQYSLAATWLIIFGLSGVLYFSLQLAKAPIALQPVKTFAASKPTHKNDVLPTPLSLERSEPQRIRIAKFELDLKVLPVAQNADGTIEMPPLFEQSAGWYNLGPTPGEIGPAVIVGHVDTYKGPSVFFRLGELQPGDQVEITRADGQIAKFRVTQLEQFSQSDFPTEKIYGNTAGASLRLITCGGTFDRTTGHYSVNTVVFATLIAPTPKPIANDFTVSRESANAFDQTLPFFLQKESQVR